MRFDAKLASFTFWNLGVNGKQPFSLRPIKHTHKVLVEKTKRQTERLYGPGDSGLFTTSDLLIIGHTVKAIWKPCTERGFALWFSKSN